MERWEYLEELAAKIAALTEDLEELRSEKNLLLASLAYIARRVVP